jgi:Na+-transporting NADH:ubiquinone oxidoreductase subunit NqrA
LGVYDYAYRDKKVVGVFVRFRCRRFNGMRPTMHHRVGDVVRAVTFEDKKKIRIVKFTAPAAKSLRLIAAQDVFCSLWLLKCR